MLGEWVGIIIFMIVFAGVMTFLYFNGIIETSCKAALVFVHERTGKSEKFHINRCTGTLRRIMKFKEEGTYEFTLDYSIASGSAEVVILDRQKVEIARLDGDCSRTAFFANKGERYYLKWKFGSASGECELKWGLRDSFKG
ncbi:MAG: hypothetical protein K2N72_07985 [Oscillospiraceae bacterium]|nr:hypothetical protein [Oscillospiraceae bacterium]